MVRQALVIAVCSLAGILSVKGFHEVAHRYDGFRLEYGVGVSEIPPMELVFYAWYLLFGTVAALFLARSLFASSVPGSLLRAFRALSRRRAMTFTLSVTALLATILLFQRFVLGYAPISDDESTYAFIAQTLLQGRVVNPSPGDVPFFRNQFVVLDDHVWYGKYPIGHPLLLALGEAFGARHLVAPLVTGACFLLTFAVGRRIFPQREALLGTLLLLMSPHFVFTGATQLSQPTAMLCLLFGLWGLLRIETERPILSACVAGFGFGFGVLVRPLPGLLFVVTACVYFLFVARSLEARRTVGVAAAGAFPMLLCAAVFLLVNFAQTGGVFRSGYQEFHGDRMGALSYAEGAIAASVGGALLRQNFWLFGWPLSLLFAPFARRSPRAALLWGMVLAEYAYRVISPKTVVGTTGPIYVTEIVPLLALATASGLYRLKDWFEQAHVGASARAIVAAVVALATVAGVMFLPVQLRSIRRSAVAWLFPYWQIEAARKGDKALVFAATMVEMEAENTWAYLPPNPSPHLDDEVIFVRSPITPAEAELGIDFWRRRFPDRRAWVLRFSESRPVLREVHATDDLVAR